MGENMVVNMAVNMGENVARLFHSLGNFSNLEVTSLNWICLPLAYYPANKHTPDIRAYDSIGI